MSQKPTPCEPTKEQLQLWSDTRVALSWHCPGFTHIFMSLLDTTGSKHIALFTKDVPIAATDGSAILINPDTFFKFDLMERLFITAHEILHCTLNHLVLMHRWRKLGKVAYPDGKKVEYNHDLMNIAQDLVINDILIDAGIGKFKKGEWLHDTSIATKMDSAVDVYRKLYEKNKKRGRGRGPGPAGPGNNPGNSPGDPNQQEEPLTSGGNKRFDDHLAPGVSQGKDPHQAAKDHNEVEWQTVIAAAANIERLMRKGNMPAGLERLFQEILTPQVDWRDSIRALFNRKVGTGSWDWQRPDRRLIVRDIYAPSRSGYGAGCVVVGVDTSGSVGQKEIDIFMAEVSGILEDVRPKRLIIVWCDAAIHRVDECHDTGDLNTLRCKGAPGGGGTDFRPVFDYIDSEGLEPDALVYLTDGQGDFPAKAPKYECIWGSIYPQSIYPFGDVVQIPRQEAA